MPNHPAAETFSALESATGLLFMLWHTWHYDHWRCLVYSRDNWFRAMMTQILLGSACLFVVNTWMDFHILYAEYYAYIGGRTIPTPWQLWSPSHLRLWRASLYVLCAGWCMLQAVHLEEFLYWGYLIQGIRTPGGPKWSWISSPWFKCWVVAFISMWGILFGAVSIETENIDYMRAYLFLVGSIISCMMAIASVILCFVMPGFIKSVQRQGATFEIGVFGLLCKFAEIALPPCPSLVLAGDAMTADKRVNKSRLWSEVFYLLSQLGVYGSTTLSVVILLPRNMTIESYPDSANSKDTIHPMVPYRPPAPSSSAHSPFSPQRQFYELGDRLNIEKDALSPGLVSESTHELQPKDSLSPVGAGMGMGGGFDEESGVGSSLSRKIRFSEMPSLPGVVAKLRGGPLEIGADAEAGVGLAPWHRERAGRKSHVVITTETTVERE